MILKNCDANRFITGLDGKKIICFGAGTTLIEADFEVLTIPGLEDHIAFFVDNDTKKHDLNYKYRGHEYGIYSPERLITVNIEKYVLLITCAFYVEIYEQLKDMDYLANMDCYMYNCICSYPELDLNDFFDVQIKKDAYANFKSRLKDLNLKNIHKGKRCFIVGNGPSLTIEDLEKLKGEYTFAANRIFKAFKDTDWRPTYYFCTDYLMYGIDHNDISELEVDYKFVPIERALAAGVVYDNVIYYNRVVNCTEIVGDEIKVSRVFSFTDDVVEQVYGGQTVLYDAIQMAVYMGFSDIYLIGVDNNYKKELKEDGNIVDTGLKDNHFCKEYDEGLEGKIAVVARLYLSDVIFDVAKRECEVRGCRIMNATRGGRLEMFDRVSLEQIGL